MSIPHTGAGLGNVLRLSGLKNVRGRRVMPGAEYMEPIEGIEELDTDVTGTAAPLPNFENFISPPKNEPEPDLGGELTSQSYDVRANSVNTPPSPPEEPSLFSRIGSALADYVNPTKRDEMSAQNAQLMQQAQQAPPVFKEAAPETAIRPAPEPSAGVFGAIADYFNPTKNAEMNAHNADLIQDAQLRAKGSTLAQEVAGDQQVRSEEIQKAMEQPWQNSVYGSAMEVANSPVLQAQFKEVTGIDYEPQIAQQVAQVEGAMQAVEDSINGINTSLDANSEGIKQRILNNQTTDSDKYLIGLALLMPLLIGGMFGKEAGLGALAGGAKGVADVLGNREKGIREDEASLLNIDQQRLANQKQLADMAVNRANFEPNLRKNLPKDPREHLIGMREIEFTDPETGNPTKGYEVKPGLVAKAQFVNSPEDKKIMQQAAKELSEVKTYTQDVSDLTNDVIEIVSQLDDKNIFSKGFASIISKGVPGSLSQLTQDVMFEGRMQNAGTLLQEKLGFLANKYGMAQDLGQLDRAAQNHIKNIMDNPTNTLLSNRDAINQMIQIQNLTQKGLINQAENNGFYPEFIMQELQERNQKMYGKLNQSEDDKYNEELKREAFQNERNYAK